MSLLKISFCFMCLIFHGLASEEGRRLEILFLGDQGGHKPSERYPQLLKALGPRGINLTYTEKLSDLSAKVLNKYDGLMIYANINTLPKANEEALLDYIESGHGFIPLHCASFCFRNSEAYVKLVGGQFKKHGAGTFFVPISKPNHDVMKGLEAFETWDETYIHTKHNEEGRTVLQYRTEGNHQEPWTWVRKQSKGRVFYTAYGHNDKTWGHPGFHDLVSQGIKWAVGDKAMSKLTQLNLPDFVYSKEATVQNYEKRTPAPLFQHALTPAESKKHTQWPVDFELQLFASEPDIKKPVYIAFDERGRCWVAETLDYPNQVNEDRKGNDRIRILEDTNGDGKADSFKTFIDGINIPTSFTFHNGGIIVGSAPHMYYFKDTDGDDKADIKKVISSGWGIRDTHAGISNLKYGFDNYFYGAVGYSGYDGKEDSHDLKFRSGVYRFKHDFSEVEFLSQFSNNTWGLGFSENFDLFGSTANRSPSIYVGIPNRYYTGINGLKAPQGKKIVSHTAAFPNTDKYRQVDVFGGFTAATGHNLYTARSFPKEYWNQMAFVSEPTLNLLANFKMVPDGAGFRQENNWNLTASADGWFSPIHAEVGPDGAVWMLDWYNFIIQHNPTPKIERGGFMGVTGKGNAHENPLRDKTHGRIWRVVYKQAPKTEKLVLSKEKPNSLLAGLRSDNMFWRTTAQRLIIERGKKDLVPELSRLIENMKTDEIGINGAAIHALYALSGLNAIDGSAYQSALRALSHPSVGVRKAALNVLPRSIQTAQAILNQGLLEDANFNVVKDALLALSEHPPMPEIASALVTLGLQKHIDKDEWLKDALSIASFRQSRLFLQAYLNRDLSIKSTKIAQESSLMRAAKLIVLNSDKATLSQLASKSPMKLQNNIFKLISLNEKNVSKPVNRKDMVAQGKKVFSTFCFSCHGIKGEGTVGPNLTDMHFLHGDKKSDMERTIRKGVVEKGMLPWESMLNERQIRSVVEYVWGLRGKNVKGGKPPEGLKAN